MASGPFGPANTQNTNAQATGATDLKGTFLGNAPVPGQQQQPRPRVVANPFNNTLLIQASPQDYENILTLLKDLDVPPRQVLIEAKIYSIDLTHAFSSDVKAQLLKVSGGTASGGTAGGTASGGTASGSTTPAAPKTHSFFSQFVPDFGNGATNLSTAALVGMPPPSLPTLPLQHSTARPPVP